MCERERRRETEREKDRDGDKDKQTKERDRERESLSSNQAKKKWGVCPCHPPSQERASGEANLEETSCLPRQMLKVGNVSTQTRTSVNPNQYEYGRRTDMCSGSEAGSYLRLIDFYITPIYV